MARPKKVVVEDTKEVQNEAITEQQGETTPPAPAKLRGKVVTSKFSLLDREDIVAEQKDLMAKAGHAAAFQSIADVNRECLPLPWFAMQFLFGNIGIPVRTFTEIIGQECVGKSSLMIALALNFIKNNIPTYYVNTEPKQIQGPWLKRLAGNDPVLGAKLIKALPINQCSTYDIMDDNVRSWIKVMRGDMKVPMEVPLVIIIDSMTNLMSPEEAANRVSADASMSDQLKRLDKGVAQQGQKIGSAATWMSHWVREFGDIMEQFNVTVLATAGQSTKMSTGGNMNADAAASLNGERVGGTALKKDSACRFTVTRAGFWKNSDGVILGEEIRARSIKNSYGSKVNDIKYRIRNKYWSDGPNKVDQAIDMSEALGAILVQEGVCGFKVNRKRYSSAELGIEQATAKQLEEFIESNEAVKIKLGRALGINGYEAYDDTET